jgi:uncharacterized membrane protein YesL
MKFFSVDSGFYRFMQSLLALVKINFLWLLCSIPIVTMGAATIAAFDVTMKMAKDEEGYVAHQFMRAFKANIRNGIPLGILFLFCLYAVWLDFSLFNQLEGNPMILLVMGMVSGFIFLMAFIFAFPLQARYENTLFRTLKNSVDIATRYFLRTLSLIFILFVEIVIIFWNRTTMFIGLLIGPACMIFTVSGYANFFFRELEREQENFCTSCETRQDSDRHIF